MIGCKCEAAIERPLAAAETPDGRPGIAVLLFAMDREGVGKRVLDRVGQSVMTCPTTACFDGLAGAEKTVPLGKSLRYFGDGFQASKVIAGQRFWRIPVMEGEFLVTESVGVGRGVGGGNLVIGAGDEPAALAAAEAAAERCAARASRCRSRAGSSAAAARSARSPRRRCPRPPTTSWRRRCARRSPDTLVPEGVGAMFEIVIDGVSEEAVREAMRRGLHAAAGAGRHAHHRRQLRRQARRVPLPALGAARPAMTLTLTLRTQPPGTGRGGRARPRAAAGARGVRGGRPDGALRARDAGRRRSVRGVGQRRRAADARRRSAAGRRDRRRA